MLFPLQTIPQDQIAATLGQNRYWFPKELPNLIYLYGIPTLEANHDAARPTGEQTIDLKALPRGLQISLLHSENVHSVGLPYSDIKQVELASLEEISSRRDKTLLGHAVLHGVLPEPIAAVIGRMSGLIGEGQLLEFGDNLLTIQVEQQGQTSYFIALILQSMRKQTKMYLYKNLKRFLVPSTPRMPPLVRHQRPS
jgi:hypothetical protein